MKPLQPQAQRRVDMAQRVADAHRALGDASLLALVSGSTVEDLVDERSDIDMSIVLAGLPPEEALRSACRQSGGGDWTWKLGDWADGGGVVSFPLDGIEVQVAYCTHHKLQHDLDELLLRHNPDTPLHKLAEGLLKARPLAGHDALVAVQQRLGAFPSELGLAMIRHGLATPMPWRIVPQLLQRDAGIWLRELQVEACYRLLLMLCGLNGRYFTRFQVKRQGRLAQLLRLAPAQLSARMDALLAAPPLQAFELLHALEGEVLDLIERHQPAVDLAAARQRRSLFPPA